ncbi:hypothetical protein TSOC_006274 [Tetrabaena socialis]|uniref:Uncharacterized protein n=1 Tax=Tetrabaena socialis TaxID=47790 RepID=A0A2J8A442_9CHLO|nr:hypothetical protein TSOC_006274 [Tetrabaena socialis]|eukprot:PNH07284.1 hypothetical protein TSOC_006274 [Tetrabaena socialis]
MLPPAALQKAGTLSVFVLPPSPADAASPAAAAAPVAAFPLLALPAAAAAEVRQLYGAVLDDAVYESLQQLLLEGTAGGGPDGWRLAASASAAAASASTAIRQSGLTSLSHDIGELLQLPVSTVGEAFERGAGDGDGGGAPEEQQTFEAWSFANLLHFLASQRMGACLREGLRALRRAGVQLTCNGQAYGNGGGAVEAAALQLIREAGEAWSMNIMGGSGQPPSPLGPVLLPSTNKLRPAGPPPPPPASGGGVPPTLDRRLSSEAGAGPSQQPTPSTARDAAVSSSHPPGRSLRPWALSLGGTLRWWFHVLLLGFSPPGQERSYQAFKAARCWRVNLMHFGLVVATRLATCFRTLLEVQAMPADAAPVPAADGLGAGRLTELQQQLLAQAFFLAAGLLITALAFGTPLLHRRRTALLLSYKAVVDPLSHLLILWPPAWGGPLLRVPEAWLDADRRYGLHWLHHGLLEPGLLQLAPRHQLWAALANLLPMTLLGYHVYRGRWAPALGFGFGSPLLALALALATDYMTRWQFVRCWRSNPQPDKAE